MDTNKMRDAFSEFVRRKPRHLRDAYQRAFEAGWQASREAVVVELPKPVEIDSRDGYREAVLWPDEVVEPIEAQGLKVEVKP